MKMHCPRCQVALHHREDGLYATSFCSTCGGLFVSSKKSDTISAAQTRDSVELAEMLDAHATSNSHKTSGPIDCPMCLHAMQEVHLGALVIDRCQEHGVWYDKSELQLALKIYDSSSNGNDSKNDNKANESGLELAREPRNFRPKEEAPRRIQNARYEEAAIFTLAQKEQDRQAQKMENMASLSTHAAFDFDDLFVLGDLLEGIFNFGD